MQMSAPLHIVNNKRAFRFETQAATGELITLSYRWLKGNMLLMQTIMPPAVKDTKIAGELIKHVLEHARTHELKITVYCPFVTEYMQQHPEYNMLMA